MALFLNTPKLNFWIPKLIQKAEKELILIVPYIQMSETIFKSLKIADDKGIEIILIYRENKLNKTEKEKLLSLNHISLLHHPNIHCKCYFNGDLLIIGSMNLYDYSEKNNREMGTLFHTYNIDYENGEELPDNDFSENYDEEDIFIDAIDEIKAIITGAEIEQVSEKNKKTCFEIDIIKTYEELSIESCGKLNKFFLNKKFKPYEQSRSYWHPRCENFFDKVDVTFEHRRIAIRFNLPTSELKALHREWKKTYKEFEFNWFKYYWNYHTQDVLIYTDSRYDWRSLDNNDELRHQKYSQGIDCVIKKYRGISGK